MHWHNLLYMSCIAGIIASYINLLATNSAHTVTEMNQVPPQYAKEGYTQVPGNPHGLVSAPQPGYQHYAPAPPPAQQDSRNTVR